jgi:hypothetical protein
MDICGQFVNRDSLLGIVAALTDVGFSTRHNFNLLSVTSLWQQGQSTQSGDSEGLVKLNGIRDTREGHCFGGNPKWASELSTFGEAAVVKEKKSDKTTDRGITVIFVGYSLDCTSDCYRFWNPDKNSIIETCDAIFLNQMYFG